MYSILWKEVMMKKLAIFIFISFFIVLAIELTGTIGRFHNIDFITKFYIYYDSYLITIILASMINLLTYKSKEKVLPYFISSLIILGVVNYIIMDLNNKYFYTFDRIDNIFAFIIFTPFNLLLVLLIYEFEGLIIKIIKFIKNKIVSNRI